MVRPADLPPIWTGDPREAPTTGDCVAYLVWQVDCRECGTVITYDADSHPDACEECGAPVEEQQ